jgi:hypothetical protein
MLPSLGSGIMACLGMRFKAREAVSSAFFGMDHNDLHVCRGHSQLAFSDNAL